MDEVDNESEIEYAIRKAVKFLSKGYNERHIHSQECYNVLKHVLYEDEYTVIEAKQSRLKSLAPTRLIATNRRIIVMHPSFFSLLTGLNIFSTTKYQSIPYNNIVNISLSNGLTFSALYLHLNTSKDEEGYINGLKMKDAEAMFAFLEKMTEFLKEGRKENVPIEDARLLEEEPVNRVKLQSAEMLSEHSQSKFIWLGAEPLEYVADRLGIKKNSILKMDMEELKEAAIREPGTINGSILICYNGSFAAYISKFLKHGYDIDSYVLEKGLGADKLSLALRRGLSPFHKELKPIKV